MTFSWQGPRIKNNSENGFSTHWMLNRPDGSEFLEFVVEGNDGNIYFIDFNNNVIHCKSIPEAKLSIESILISEIRSKKLDLLILEKNNLE